MSSALHDHDQRELSTLDAGFLMDDKPFLKFVWFSDRTSFTTERNIREGFNRGLKMTPILKTKIVEVETTTTTKTKEEEGDGSPRFVFTQHDSEKEWPQVQVHVGDYDRDQVAYMANDLASKAFAFYGYGGSTEAKTVSLQTYTIIGSTRVAIVMVWPKMFMDGASISGFLVKSLMYARLPRALWFTVDKLSSKDMPPTLEEMAFKQDYEKIMSKKGELQQSSSSSQSNNLASSAKLDPRNFSFSNYSPGDEENLRGGKFEFQTLSIQRINAVRKELREAGVSMSSAMSALSVKTMALILHKNNLNPDCRPMVVSSHVDLRNLGKWGDSRDKRKLQLPMSANLTVIACTQIPYEEAVQEGSLMKMASRIKQDIKRLESDLDYRAETVLFSAGYPKCNVACGASSFMVPHMDMGKWTGIHNPYIETYEHYSQPHVWFTLVTMDKLSSTPGLYAGLPIAGLSMDQIFEAAQEATMGSPFEGFFQQRQGVEAVIFE